MKLLAFLLGTAASTHAHAVLTKPISRALRLATGSDDGLKAGGSCPGAACTWYSQDVRIPGFVTNCDPSMRTMGVSCDSTNPPDFPCTPGASAPWCAPGSAPVRSPCGIFSGGWGTNGRDMLDLPSPVSATWAAGEVAEVAFAITANHGGGYAYRLCPDEQEPTEECFQAHHLLFSGYQQYLLHGNGTRFAAFNATRLSKGTTPLGSQWTRNPVPMEKGFGPGIPGQPLIFGRGPFEWSLVDQVLVPASLPEGKYVLSFRWDAEQTKQVWSHCSDVQITSQITSLRKKPSTPPKDVNVCIGGSLGLDVHDCDAWVAMYDAMGGEKWPDSWKVGCSSLRLDPCGCTGDWNKSIMCNSQRDLLRITEMYLLGAFITGTIPPEIGTLSSMISLSIVGTKLTGSVPEELGNAKSLSMLWLDHNPTLGGPIPHSFGKLNFSAFELHMSAFSGVAPVMDYASIPDCTLNGLVFKCPLPKGADTCGAACK